MSQSHHTPGLFPGFSCAHLNQMYSILPCTLPIWGRTKYVIPYGDRRYINARIITLRTPYGFWYCRQSANSPRVVRKGIYGPIWAPHDIIRHPYLIFSYHLGLCQIPYVPVTLSYHTRADEDGIHWKLKFEYIHSTFSLGGRAWPATEWYLLLQFSLSMTKGVGCDFGYINLATLSKPETFISVTLARWPQRDKNSYSHTLHLLMHICRHLKMSAYFSALQNSVDMSRHISHP